MELRDLRGLVMLGDTLHFGQAAARLHITQSALSKQIRRLESELGQPLFERGAHGVRPTALGRALLDDARSLVTRSDALLTRARDVTAGVAGCVRIGFGVAVRDIVPTLIARFRAARPQVKIELSDLSTHHQIVALNEGRLDLGFCRLPAPPGWPALPVKRAHFVAVLPAAYETGEDLLALVRRPLVLIRRAQAPSFHDHLMRFFAHAGLRPAEILPVNDFPAAVTLAAAGVGWAMVPSSTLIAPAPVRAVPLLDAAAGWTIGLVRPPGEPDVLVAALWEEALRLAAQAPTTSSTE